MKIYIGYDTREPLAYAVAEHSLLAASGPLTVTPLKARTFAEQGLLRRPTDTRGQLYDLLSNAPASTEFAISRFLVPFLAQTGWALFVDSDVVFLNDAANLFKLANKDYALMCVKHKARPVNTHKMDNQQNLAYPRKNWSSVMLWNCDHPANRRLSLVDVQERRGFDLHGFYWLHDSEIGELPAEWNWLVNVEPKPEYPRIAHFTMGGPFLPGWTGAPNDGIWLDAHERMINETQAARA